MPDALVPDERGLSVGQRENRPGKNIEHRALKSFV